MGAVKFNPDKITSSVDLASVGPRLGFLGAYEQAYDEQTLIMSRLGAAVYMRDREQENIQRIRALGEEPPPSLSGMERGTAFAEGGFFSMGAYSDYLGSRTAMEDATDLDEKNEIAEKMTARLGRREQRIRELQKKYPDAGIETYDDMFRSYRQRVDKLSFRSANQPRSLAGSVGGLAGGIIGSVNPRTDPLNFAGLLAGGPGRTVVQRLAYQGLVNAGLEGVNQATGARENMRIAGRDPTLSDSLLSVGFAGLAGVVFQGAGEGLVAAARGVGRRWFAPEPGAPPPPAPTPRAQQAAPQPTPRFDAIAAVEEGIADLGRTRMGRSRIASDLDSIRQQLDSGVNPIDLVPPTATRLPRPGTGVELPAAFQRASQATPRSQVEVAREFDPQAFNAYDTLNAKATTIRAQLQALSEPEARRASAAATGVDQQIAQLQQRLENASPRQRQRLQEELDELQATRQSSFSENAGREAELRQQLMKLDEKLRDLAPVISRALARAEGKFKLEGEQLAAINEAVVSGRVDQAGDFAKLLSKTPDEITSIVPRRTLADDVVELRNAEVRAGEPAIDTVNRVRQAQAKLTEDAAEAFRLEAGRLARNVDEKEIAVSGYDKPLNLDEDAIVAANEDGTGTRLVTVRQLLQEIDEDNITLKALGTCSTVTPS